MTSYARFTRRAKGKNYSDVELQYSIYHLIAGNPVWWCRIWNTESKRKKSHGQSYGKTKFEAYRKAKKDLEL